jgi:hypothetical protein
MLGVIYLNVDSLENVTLERIFQAKKQEKT